MLITWSIEKNSWINLKNLKKNNKVSFMNWKKILIEALKSICHEWAQ